MLPEFDINSPGVRPVALNVSCPTPPLGLKDPVNLVLTAPVADILALEVIAVE